MKSGLFWKLFLLQLLAATAVVAGALLAARWYSVRYFAEFMELRERERVEQVASEVAQAYARTGDLRAAADEVPALRRPMHRRVLKRGLPPRPPESPEPPPPPPEHEGPPPHEPGGHFVVRRELLGPPLQLQDESHAFVHGDDRQLPEERVTEPVVVDGRTIGYLAWPKFRGRAEHQELAHREMKHLRVIAPVALLVAGLFAALITALIVTPIKRLSEATAALTRRDFSTRVAAGGNDELGALAADFNRLAAALEGYDARQRQWLADIAHELRTPLAVLRGELEAMIEGVRTIGPSSIRSLREETARLEALVQDLQLVALAESGGLRLSVAATDVSALVRESAERFAARFRASGFELKVDVADGLQAEVDAQRLDQVLANLFQNILMHAAPPGPVAVAARAETRQIRISISDGGPGVPSAMLPRLFDRLYRVDPSRPRPGGSGLGLAIAKSIVEAHGGTVTALKSGAGGLEIQIRIPAASGRP